MDKYSCGQFISQHLTYVPDFTTFEQTLSMEVHHSHHVAHKKKWTEYLLEFLMLFLAVFLGFLAEYYLEHKIEHNREKQFMKSMVEDLAIDTAELKRNIFSIDEAKRYSDSVIIFLNSFKPSSVVPISFSNQMTIAQQRLRLTITDRTSTQLKNAGGMRLIQNKKVADTIVRYWKQIENSHSSLERYLSVRETGRALMFKLYKLPIAYADSSQFPIQASVEIIDDDPRKWKELTNLVAISRQIARGEHSTNLHNQFELAARLIEMIKKEYHL